VKSLFIGNPTNSVFSTSESKEKQKIIKERVLQAGGLRVLQDLATREWPEGEKEVWNYVVHNPIDQNDVTINWPTKLVRLGVIPDLIVN